MAYLNTYNLAQDPQLWQRMVPAVAEVAVAVYNEAGTVPSHAVRLALVAYAGPRTSDFTNFAKELALLLCVLNPTLTTASTDPQIKTAIENVWTPYALVLQAKGQITVAA